MIKIRNALIAHIKGSAQQFMNMGLIVCVIELTVEGGRVSP